MSENERVCEESTNRQVRARAPEPDDGEQRPGQDSGTQSHATHGQSA